MATVFRFSIEVTEYNRTLVNEARIFLGEYIPRVGDTYNITHRFYDKSVEETKRFRFLKKVLFDESIDVSSNLEGLLKDWLHLKSMLVLIRQGIKREKARVHKSEQSSDVAT
jgi:hypothetical protein